MSKDKDNIMMCRCEDVTQKQIDEKMDVGFDTFEDLKRLLRVGMGSCQAQTCGHMIQSHIASRTNQDIKDVKTQKTRPMLQGVKLKDIVESNKP